MASINVDLEYFTHPKTTRLIDLLGRGAEVLPLRLWCFCGKYHAQDGRLTGYAGEEIERLLGWWGKPGKAIDAMLTCGQKIGKDGYLCKGEDGVFYCHEWLERQGHIMVYKNRAIQANAKRWGGHDVQKSEHPSSNASRTPSRNPLAMQCNKKSFSLIKYEDDLKTNVNIDTVINISDEIKSFVALGWDTQRIKQHLLMRNVPEHDIDLALGKHF